ncbi:hypothetical protein [Aestuariivivens sediminis]|uniref:hypothetical protein n=1 Tax=Aestuariivivens sediminis TaxID=2913557 RepID=UPI001F5624AD|nr:hypothetical protein [Aestuariivivens sediminis]
MKRPVIYLLILALSFTSCSLNTDTNDNQQSYKSLWHLRNVSGGVSGVNDDFELETIIWTFNEVDAILTVENNNTDDTKQDGLDTGTYSYSVIQEGSSTFLSVDGTEMGEVVVTQSSMVIDENETSGGPAADGFIYTFQRVLVAE